MRIEEYYKLYRPLSDFLIYARTLRVPELEVAVICRNEQTDECFFWFCHGFETSAELGD